MSLTQVQMASQKSINEHVVFAIKPFAGERVNNNNNNNPAAEPTTTIEFFTLRLSVGK